MARRSSVARFSFIAYELRELGRVSAQEKAGAIRAAERVWPGRVVHVQSVASVTVAREEFAALMRSRRFGRYDEDDDI
jgi:hypothetical protein